MGSSAARAIITPENQHAFGKITELSSSLMSNGEYDVYNLEKESFERAARLFAPATVGVGGGGGDMFAEDDDMFAADSDDEKKDAGGGGGEDKNNPKNVENAAKKVKFSAPSADTTTTTTSTSSPDFNSMGIKDLKQYITSRGGDPSGAVEKAELVSRAAALQHKSSSTTPSTASHHHDHQPQQHNVPEGYVLADAASGMYYSAASGMWYSADNGGFTDGQGHWWYFDGSTQQFVEWK